MSAEMEICTEVEATKVQDGEPRRTFVVIAFLLGLAAWVVWAALDYRAMHYVPDFPRYGTKIVWGPRGMLGSLHFLSVKRSQW